MVCRFRVANAHVGTCGRWKNRLMLQIWLLEGLRVVGDRISGVQYLI